jgi:hypothetical protein
MEVEGLVFWWVLVGSFPTCWGTWWNFVVLGRGLGFLVVRTGRFVHFVYLSTSLELRDLGLLVRGLDGRCACFVAIQKEGIGVVVEISSFRRCGRGVCTTKRTSCSRPQARGGFVVEFKGCGRGVRATKRTSCSRPQARGGFVVGFQGCGQGVCATNALRVAVQKLERRVWVSGFQGFGRGVCATKRTR